MCLSAVALSFSPSQKLTIKVVMTAEACGEADAI